MLQPTYTIDQLNRIINDIFEADANASIPYMLKDGSTTRVEEGSFAVMYDLTGDNYDKAEEVEGWRDWQIINAMDDAFDGEIKEEGLTVYRLHAIRKGWQDIYLAIFEPEH